MLERRTLFLGTLLLLNCCALFAEQQSEKASQATAGSAPPESAAGSAIAPPAALLTVPKPASDSTDSKPATRVEAEIVDASVSPGLNTYLNSSVLPMIRANWYRLVSKSTENVAGDATVEFTVLKDGSVATSNLAEGASHAALGDMALSAVRKSGPFPSLPPEVTSPSLAVRARFWFDGTRPSASPAAKGVTGNVDGIVGPVFRVGGAVAAPRPVYQPEPEFSEEARRKKVSGSVTLALVVTSEGEVTNVKVVHRLGSGLDEKAVEAVKQWKFKPATKDGEPVAVALSVEVYFQIKTKGNQ